MIQKYIEKLIDNLPEKYKSTKNPLKIDIIFDGGLFNGSDLVGVGMFLKEMEKRNFIIVERISGTSIGSFISLLYISDKLELFEEIYKEMLTFIKRDYNFKDYNKVLENLKPKLPKNICQLMNNRVFINYHDIKKFKKIVKSYYTSINDVFKTITKSSFLPFIINGDPLYKNKYIDGINPHIFAPSTEKKALFIDLHSVNKTFDSIDVKNEKSNFHRILTGVLEIHNFFIKDERRTDMCSYVEHWSPIDYLVFYGIRCFVEKIIIYFVYYFVILREKCHSTLYFKDFLSEKNILYKIFMKISRGIYIILLDNYFI